MSSVPTFTKNVEERCHSLALLTFNIENYVERPPRDKLPPKQTKNSSLGL